MKKKLIKPVTLKGFRDYLPGPMLARERLIEAAQNVYRSYGFSPIDTPALEYSEILLGKGGGETEKQVFRFQDQGGRDVAMRFDLTIPFARFAAGHLQEIGTPFKRYHIGTVWRAEKPQKGRYREFMQCDFDTIGTKSNTADIETLLVIHDLFDRIGGIFPHPDLSCELDFEIHVNNRMLLTGLLEKRGLTEKSTEILRTLDKIPKIGRKIALQLLVDNVGLTNEDAEWLNGKTFDVSTGTWDSAEQSVRELRAGVNSDGIGAEGVERLYELLHVCRSAGIPERRIVLNPGIARGLDYYTGTIYETFLKIPNGWPDSETFPSFGSVCSGGRYDNLAGLYTSQQLPGVGASLGLDRLLAALEDLGRLPAASTSAEVLIVILDKEFIGESFHTARRLRQAEIPTEIFADPPPPGRSPGKSLGKQLKYADRKGFRIALIAGTEEFASKSWQVKDLASGEQQNCPAAELIPTIKAILQSGC